uniref:Uncharacterized protein n=1 Tax=viral metagenome TaxID=1070528 RepID=A0A6C0L2I8_9ZZZZ|tara:strand:+ start:3516 stop:4328 length:813 start_codon:yes stop_codon:yes gene_type:complete
MNPLRIIVFEKKRRINLVSKLLGEWIYYTKKRLVHRRHFYGRIRALDVKAVKAMVRKDDQNHRRLIKNALSIIFDNTNIYNRKYNQVEDYPLDYRYEGTAFDHISHFYRYTYYFNQYWPHIAIQTGTNTWFSLKERFDYKEKMTIRMLRFFLKKGCDPNDEAFIEKFILTHNYHCKTFFLKMFFMCIQYGLKPNNLLQILKKHIYPIFPTKKYYIGPLLDIHTNILKVEDNVNLCINWVTKQNFIKATTYSLGELSKLNDDVIGRITLFF